MILMPYLFPAKKMITARGSPIFCLSGRASDKSRERREWFRPTIFLTPGAKGVNMSVISARVRWMSDLSLHCARSRILLWQSAGDTPASGKQLGSQSSSKGRRDVPEKNTCIQASPVGRLICIHSVGLWRFYLFLFIYIRFFFLSRLIYLFIFSTYPYKHSWSRKISRHTKCNS